MIDETQKIAVDNACIAFRNVDDGLPLTVLDSASFAISEGQFVCLVGPSGCGKTTLLKAIAGLLTLSKGRILVGGVEIRAPDRDRAVVFQYDCLLPWRTVLRNAMLGWDIRGSDRKTAEEKSLYYLNLVGLGKFTRYFPHQLSGGMRQRVNLARALAVEPDILLMDEPFAALDAQTREIMQSELLRIWADTGKTVLFVTHQVDEAIFLADRVIVMGTQPGRIIDDITVNFDRPRELAIKSSVEFGRLSQRIWSQLASENVQLREAELQTEPKHVERARAGSFFRLPADPGLGG